MATKNILITGVLGGMGIETAKAFLQKGYKVYGLDTKPACPIDIEYYKADLTDITQVEAVNEKIKSSCEGLDMICHFAGIYNMASLIEISEEDFIKIFNINLFNQYRVNKVFFPLLKEGSKILITSSELAPLYPLPFTGIYAITKSAVERYAQSLRMELNLRGIKVIVLRPGAVKTDMIGVSTAALDKLCTTTTLYKTNTKRFKKIVDSVEAKSVAPSKIAKLAVKVEAKKHPKLTYNINRNPLLRLLNALPQKWQVAIIKGILKPKNVK